MITPILLEEKLRAGKILEAEQALDWILNNSSSFQAADAERFFWVFNFLYCFKEAICAIKFLDSENNDLSIIWPTYYKSLALLCEQELKILFSKKPGLTKLAFIGCGALPLSCIFYARAGLTVLGTDSRASAVFTARKVLAKLGIQNIKLVVNNNSLKDFDPQAVVVSNTAGWTNHGKANLVQQITRNLDKPLILVGALKRFSCPTKS